MQKIYFDTEFEGLFENAGLISIGLTDSSGKNTFYAELVDTYEKQKCSEFCKKIVLPLLEGNHYQMTLKELRDNLWQWLSKLEENSVLIFDSNRDISQIKFLFPNGLPSNCSFQVIGSLDKWKRRLFNFRSKLHKKYNLRPHHALDDALVNRIIFEKE